MAPGPLTSLARGGNGYTFSRSQAFASRNPSFDRADTAYSRQAHNPLFSPQRRDLDIRRRFAVGGSTEIVLTPGPGRWGRSGPTGRSR